VTLPGAIFGGVQWGLLAWGLSGGVASFFSPCALPMLPAYLSFYLSTESEAAAPDGGAAVGSQSGSLRGASLQRGVLFGSLASLGLLSVFALTALLASVLGEVLTQMIPILIPVTGVVLIVLGGLMLADRASWLSHSVSLPDWQDPSPTQFYLFGVLFAAAALGCTAPVFFGITLTALSTGGLVGAMTVVAGYAGGMIGLFVLMTVLVALAKDETARRINQLIPYIERASAVLLIGAGGYMLYYYAQVQAL
jgi:cytochrome c-type biogenesis protein